MKSNQNSVRIIVLILIITTLVSCSGGNKPEIVAEASLKNWENMVQEYNVKIENPKLTILYEDDSYAEILVIADHYHGEWIEAETIIECHKENKKWQCPMDGQVWHEIQK